MPNISDNELAFSAAKGNVESFEKLVEIYFSGIVGVCFNITGSIHDAEDCAQEAFIKAYRNISRYDGTASFFTWVYRIAVNTCYDLKRKDKRNFTVSLDEPFDVGDGDMFLQIVDERMDPEETLINKFSDERVNQIIDSLPETYSRIIRLRDIQGLSYKDIAVIEDINEGTVKSRLARARLAFVELASKEDLYN
ncbi:MAG: sigma-70 family RNA polymerase sigma factor [Eubacteriales bacterium]|nr:sigma-70 family RNA polymerase sigma factor [Eubacteriales bacterium]